MLKSPHWHQWLLRVSLLVLPYLPFLSLLGLVALLIDVFWRNWAAIARSLLNRVLLGLSLLLILGCFFADNKSEAFLQLANYLPLFGLFVALRFLLTGPRQLELIAADLVRMAIPLNLIGILEFVFKSLRKSPLKLPAGLEWQIFGWPGPNDPNRVVSIFLHPNFFAGYLILILGLGLGLVLKIANSPLCYRPGLEIEQPVPLFLIGWQKWLIYSGTFLNLAGIFCSGSRNALVVAILQLLIFSLFLKRSRSILIAILAGLTVIAAGVGIYGFGGRQVSIQSFSGDPRLGVWQIALGLIAERPWLGWGMGSFKFLYPARMVDPNYPYIAHPHNFWLLMAAESGIPVMLVFTALVGYVCYRGISVLISQRLTDSEQPILLGYVLAFGGCIAFALFDVTLFDSRINILNWLILAGIYAFSFPSFGSNPIQQRLK